MLAHLKAALTHRLRRRESFLLTWPPRATAGGEIVSLWIAPDVPLAFRFDAAAPLPLGQDWVTELIRRSYTPRGLVISAREMAGETFEVQKHPERRPHARPTDR